MPPILSSDFIDDYRRLSDSIASGVAVVTVGRGSKFTGVTVDSFLDVSWDPPTMLVSILSLSRVMDVMECAQMFTLSVLNADQEDIATWLGASGQPNYGLLNDIPTVDGECGPAHIAQACAFFEVEVTDCHTVATHTLFSGPVVAQGGNPDTQPLVRRNRIYGTFR